MHARPETGASPKDDRAALAGRDLMDFMNLLQKE
jgi:hypothetical protein